MIGTVKCDASISKKKGLSVASAILFGCEDSDNLHKDENILGILSFTFHDKTVNYTEYMAVLAGVKLILDRYDLAFDEVYVYSDSELVINQLRGVYRCHKKELGLIKQWILTRKAKIRFPVHFRWLPRELNQIADGLACYIKELHG